MRSKKTLVLFMCVLLILAFSKGVWAAEKNYTVIFTTKNMVNPAFKGGWLGGQKAAAEYKGINLIYAAPMQPDNIAEQTSQMEDYILKRPDAIVFLPVDYVAMVPTVEKMNKAGIPVFTYCNKPAGGKLEFYVGADDEKMGHAVAKYAINSIGNKGKVIIIDGVPGAITAQDRHRGFERAIKEFPGVELLASQPGNYNRLMSMQVMENLLQRFPKVDLVLTAADTQAMGVLEAIESAGRRNEIKVTGVNGDAEAAEAILKGRLLATIDYGIYDQGYLATKAAIKFLKGEKVPKLILLPTTVINKENAKNWTLPYEKRDVPNWDELMKHKDSVKW